MAMNNRINVVSYSQNETLYNDKNEWITYNTNTSYKHNTEWNKPEYIFFLLYKV